MLPEREKEISSRLRLFREKLQIPRTKFALTLGISGERLASYESARARVPYGVVRAIASEYFLNEAWLADGTGEWKFTLDSGPDRPDTIPSGMKFSEAYDTFLEPILREESKFLASSDRINGKIGTRTGLGIYDGMRRELLRRISAVVMKAPGRSLNDYANGWADLAARIQRKEKERDKAGLPK